MYERMAKKFSSFLISKLLVCKRKVRWLFEAYARQLEEQKAGDSLPFANSATAATGGK
ncbi:hypothetical protein ACFSOZ_31630 [Mesorhizobium newzealandense]|uniref:Uncharacterized protein n=1 Tax=Mesorhizobium newzealandense TaxID=1300302 RepID=A0ABW4UHJ7_9HYPH